MTNVEIQSYLFDSKSKALKNGTFPIYLKVTTGADRNYISLKQYCKPNQWNAKKNRFNSSYPNKNDGNDFLKRAESEANKIIEHFYKQDIPFTFYRFRDIFEGKGLKDNLLEFMDDCIEELEASDKITTASSYKTTRNHIQAFCKSDNVKFKQIDFRFLKKFESHLRVKKKNKDTSIHIRMRELRAIFNRAIKEKHINANLYPFQDYTLSHLDLSTKKRSIAKEKIKEVETLDLEGVDQFAASVFLFSYYTRGMNFADMAELKWSDIYDGRINYKRKKTKKDFSIAILPQVEEILDFYHDKNITNNDFVFPIYSKDIHTTERKKVNRRKALLRRVNKSLKEVIAEKIDVNFLDLTTYVSRHSYSMVLKKSGQDIGKIQDALGHADSRTTQIYLDDLDNTTLDNMDKEVL